MSKQQFVEVSEEDNLLGKPLPWAVYLRSGELFAPAGYVVTDQDALERLLQARPMRAAQAGDRKGTRLVAADDLDGTAAPADPLHMLKHNAEGMVLTFQFPSDFEARSAHVEFYGRVPMQSIIVSAPAVRAANGYGWQHHEGMPLTVQVIFGRTVCVFKTSLQRFSAQPSGHLFLRYPTEVVSKPFRQALRVEVKLPVSIAQADGAVTGMITNLSSAGCALSTDFVLGNVGTVLKLAFRFKISGKPQFVQLNGTIRSIKGKQAQQMQYGISFNPGVDEAVEMALKSFVYERLAER